MPLPGMNVLPFSLLALFVLVSLTEGTCYIAAYGLIGKQDGWVSCPGTASSLGGVETCCLPGSECGQDSLCHVPDSADSGSNEWYLGGCTDPNYSDDICKKDCGRFSWLPHSECLFRLHNTNTNLQSNILKHMLSMRAVATYGCAVGMVAAMAP